MEGRLLDHLIVYKLVSRAFLRIEFSSTGVLTRRSPLSPPLPDSHFAQATSIKNGGRASRPYLHRYLRVSSSTPFSSRVLLDLTTVPLFFTQASRRSKRSTISLRSHLFPSLSLSFSLPPCYDQLLLRYFPLIGFVAS